MPYFTLFGFPEAWAWTLMPVLGTIDITLGVLALTAPTRAALLYMAFWGLFTASLRPLAGEGGWEFLEGTYNFGVPFLMLWVHGVGTTVRSWFVVLTEIPPPTVERAQMAQWVLRGVMAGMLIGHGAFGLVMGKTNLLQFYDTVGLGVLGITLPTLRAAIGGFEMGLGGLCLVATWPVFFLFVCVWKLGTEGLYVPAQTYGAWWEVLERGSSYAALLLWLGFYRVLAAHGVTAEGLIPRRWWLAVGRAARHLAVHLPP